MWLMLAGQTAPCVNSGILFARVILSWGLQHSFRLWYQEPQLYYISHWCRFWGYKKGRDSCLRSHILFRKGKDAHSSAKSTVWCVLRALGD